MPFTCQWPGILSPLKRDQGKSRQSRDRAGGQTDSSLPDGSMGAIGRVIPRCGLIGRGQRMERPLLSGRARRGGPQRISQSRGGAMTRPRSPLTTGPPALGRPGRPPALGDAGWSTTSVNPSLSVCRLRAARRARLDVVAATVQHSSRWRMPAFREGRERLIPGAISMRGR
jgi:hypothetical protein